MREFSPFDSNEWLHMIISILTWAKKETKKEKQDTIAGKPYEVSFDRIGDESRVVK
jgi:hypothetical protein